MCRETAQLTMALICALKWLSNVCELAILFRKFAVMLATNPNFIFLGVLLKNARVVEHFPPVVQAPLGIRLEIVSTRIWISLTTLVIYVIGLVRC